MNYGEVIKKSALQVWQYRTLWLLGIFLAILNPPGNMPTPTGSYQTDGKEMEGFINSIGSLMGEILLVVGILVLVLVLGAAFFLLLTLVRGALIRSVSVIDAGEMPKVKPSLGFGLRKMLPLAGRSLLLGFGFAIPFVLLVVLDVFLFIGTSNAEAGLKTLLFIVAVVFTIALIVVFIFGLIALSIVGELADRYIVLKGYKVIAAIKTVIDQPRKKLGQASLFWLIQFGLGIAIGIATLILILIIIVAIPIGIASLNSVAAVAVGIPLIILFLIPLGFVQAFNNVYWTNAFSALTADESPEESPETSNEHNMPPADDGQTETQVDNRQDDGETY